MGTVLEGLRGNVKPALVEGRRSSIISGYGVGPFGLQPCGYPSAVHFLLEAFWIPSAWVPSDRNLFGFKGMPFSRTSKCRCGPVVRPVEPTCAIGWPLSTTSPTLTRLFDRCA